jgi:hypothetical protein
VANKEWSDLSGAQKGAVVVAGTVQLGLLAAVLLDLYRRPEREIRDNKRFWAVAAFVNFVGPISYFLFGRRR